MKRTSQHLGNEKTLPIVCTLYVSKHTRHVDPIRVTICICYPTATIPETGFPPDTELSGPSYAKTGLLRDGDLVNGIQIRLDANGAALKKKHFQAIHDILSMFFQSIFGEFYIFYHTAMYNYPLYLTESCDYVTQS